MDNPINKARQYYYMLDGTSNLEKLESYRDGLERYLELAGVDHAALDPKGERSAEEIRDEIATRVKAPHIVKARQLYYALEETRDPNSALMYRDGIKRSLEKAGADYGALDASGEKGAHTMKLEFDRAVQKATKGVGSSRAV